jgi:hypothetical protein
MIFSSLFSLLLGSTIRRFILFSSSRRAMMFLKSDESRLDYQDGWDAGYEAGLEELEELIIKLQRELRICKEISAMRGQKIDDLENGTT